MGPAMTPRDGERSKLEGVFARAVGEGRRARTRAGAAEGGRGSAFGLRMCAHSAARGEEGEGEEGAEAGGEMLMAGDDGDEGVYRRIKSWVCIKCVAPLHFLAPATVE
jgi:hypothetical protein